MAFKKRRDQIIEKAEPIFARFGLKRATMSTIAKELQLQKGALYYYFKNKEELFMAVIEKESNNLKTKILKQIEKVEDPQKKLLNFFITRLKYLEEKSEYYTTLKDEYFEGLSFGGKILEKYFLWEQTTIDNILREGMQKGVFIKDFKKISIITSALVIALKGMEYQWAVNSNIRDMKKNIDSFLDILYKGIGV